MCLFEMTPAQTLRGRIVDKQNQPIKGARVNVRAWLSFIGLPKDIQTALTDSNGEYFINDLQAYDAEHMTPRFRRDPEGNNLTPVGEPEKLWEQWLWIRHPHFATKRTAIEKIPGRVDVKLQPGAVLTGQAVIQEAGKAPEPARDVKIHLQRDTAQDAGREFSYQTAGTRTDDKGKYRIESLPAGTYSCVAETSGWVSQGIDGIELKQGEGKEAPDLVMTRGGIVRIQLIDDKTGKLITFEQPTKGYVSPSPRPPRKSFYFPSKIVEFSTKGIGEQQVPSGKYVFFVNLPGIDGEPGWQGVDAAGIRTPEDIDKLPTHEIKEGEVLEIEVRMQKEEPRGKATLTPASSPPSDVDKKNEPQIANEFTPATPPADAEDKDAYENGVFVPAVPARARR